jgi:hypothetical protein
MHVTDTGAAGGRLDVAVDGAPVEGLVVVAFDEQAGAGGSPPGPVVGDQADQQRVQGNGAVVVELAQRDAQPVGVAEPVHGVVAQSPDLTGSHAGAGQEFDDEPAAPVGVGGESGHELRGGGIVEELRCGLVGFGQVPGEDGHPTGSVAVVPVDDALEERAQHPEVVADGLGADRLVAAFARPGGQGQLVGLDVATLDRRHRPACGVGFGQVGGEMAQRQRRRCHRRGS